jgi:hypothetical protein
MPEQGGPVPQSQLRGDQATFERRAKSVIPGSDEMLETGAVVQTGSPSIES